MLLDKMATLAEQNILPSTYFGYSKAIAGSVIPGELRQYHVRKVNFPDFSSAFVEKKQVNPIVKFPGMGETHGSGSGVMDKLKAMLQKRGEGPKSDDILGEIRKLFGGAPQPQTMPGYEAVRENRQWKDT